MIDQGSFVFGLVLGASAATMGTCLVIRSLLRRQARRDHLKRRAQAKLDKAKL